MNLDELLQLHPLVHVDQKGDPISWAIGEDVLRYLDSVLEEDWETMETGAGMSTLVFVLNGCRHTAISPATRESQVISEFCNRQGLDTSRLTMLSERSELALPRLATPRLEACLDLFLIDGRHAFPSPYIDWFYASILLKVGGLMVVDDTQILTGSVLRDFLTEDAHWRAVECFDKTAVFEKLDDRWHLDEWNEQAYIRHRPTSA